MCLLSMKDTHRAPFALQQTQLLHIVAVRDHLPLSCINPCFRVVTGRIEYCFVRLICVLQSLTLMFDLYQAKSFLLSMSDLEWTYAGIGAALHARLLHSWAGRQILAPANLPHYCPGHAQQAHGCQECHRCLECNSHPHQ